ncbi:MAG: response regulator [Candidatus Pacebacteria bacterium]|nr:response regulator [Candidatus Paceibacterota bacterium]
MKKVLIIEDEKILSEMYKFKFSKAGYKVLSAIDVKTGLEIASQEIPDLIILDILLPKENGIVFLEKMKLLDKIASIPVVVLSNFDDIETKTKAFSLGASDYLIKSNFNPTEILNHVEKFIK